MSIYIRERMFNIMNNNLKYSMIFGSALINFAFGFTNPTMVIYFTSRVDQSIYALANMMTLGLSALINNSINIDRIMNLYKKYFAYIVIADLVGSGFVYCFAIDHVAFRYIAFAVLNAITSNLWNIVMNNAINNTIGGDVLTKFNSSMSAWNNWASMIGVFLAFVLVNNMLSLNHCLVLQWLAILTMGLIDMRAYRKLRAAARN